MIPFYTVTGLLVDLEKPQPDHVTLRDVATGLSNSCRFGGQLEEHYSVAQHALLVTRLVDAPFRKHALHHDDTEAYMCDLSRHLKHHKLLSGYREIEANLGAAIASHWGLPPLMGEADAHLKCADDLAAIYEHVMFRGAGHWLGEQDLDWALGVGFVNRTSIVALKAMNSRLPVGPYPPLTNKEARARYTVAHQFLELGAEIPPQVLA